MIDQSVNVAAIQLPKYETPILVHCTPRSRPPWSPTMVPVQLEFPLRFTVHRQHVGFFTPMVLDLSFEYNIEGVMTSAAYYALSRVVEPFVEGALFCNHDSFAISEFLRGQAFGYNRKETLEAIRENVKKGAVWYSDWETPPMTIQNQRIFVYDLATHGSMLDPQNVARFIATEFLKAIKLDGLTVHITAGYVDPVDTHGAPRP